MSYVLGISYKAYGDAQTEWREARNIENDKRRKAEEISSDLLEALERAAVRFEYPNFGCNWHDAAADCRKAISIAKVKGDDNA